MSARRILAGTALAGALLLCGGPARARIAMDWVPVGDPGNAADGSIFGRVDYAYRIGKYEVTNAQYRDFLNSVATTGDPHGLYSMFEGLCPPGIVRSGGGTTANPYVYSTRNNDPAWDARPVNYVTWYNCLRFANWLHNGQPIGRQNEATTEDGAYDMSLGFAVMRKADARFWLTSENEWYKAAYYKGGGTNAGYWDYPTQSNGRPRCEPPPGVWYAASANYCYASLAVGPPYYTSEVGAYTARPSDSAYGTYDQGGNLWEWNESLGGSQRCRRGSSFHAAGELYMHAHTQYSRNWADPTVANSTFGFRLGSALLIPGDANRDGLVDSQDLGILKANFGYGTPEDPATWGMGNFNEEVDGLVDIQDFVILKAYFGQGGEGAGEPAPEPGSAVLVLLLLGGVSLRRLRRN